MTHYALSHRCPKCDENRWNFDHYEAYRTRNKIKRFACWKCGFDVFLDHASPEMLREAAGDHAEVL